MTVAIVGAGIQGCSTALELWMRGRDVVLFERAPGPMQAASRWNEGKIHLGYLYANEPSLRTARTMIRGAVVFHARLARYLDGSSPAVRRSSEFIYGIHRQSLVRADEVSAHIARVDALVRDALAAPGTDYLGTRELRPSSEVPCGDGPFDDELVGRAVRTPEAAVDPDAIADQLAARVMSEPGISITTGVDIARIEKGDDGSFWLVDRSGERQGPFEAVVNASWESRLGLDRSMGYQPAHPWMHRYKLAIHATGLEGTDDIPSVTLVLGAFGDLVNFGSGRLYLSWYPVCKVAMSRELIPPDPEPAIDAGSRAAIADAVVTQLRRIVPAVRELHIDSSDIAVRGGHIFGWGRTDITDVGSGLHQRHDVGVHSDHGYHSIDTGKYGLAPLHAMTVAARIMGDA